jgi:secretion/DNA translocation related TadE-like protein
MRGLRGDRGAGSILVVAILAAVIGLTVLSLPLYSVLVVKRAMGGAADAAALAAAEVAVGRAPGITCVVAERVAEANGAVLTDCHPDGLVVTVRVETLVLSFTVAAISSAGPPQASGPESMAPAADLQHTRFECVWFRGQPPIKRKAQGVRCQVRRSWS